MILPILEGHSQRSATRVILIVYIALDQEHVILTGYVNAGMVSLEIIVKFNVLRTVESFVVDMVYVRPMIYSPCSSMNLNL